MKVYKFSVKKRTEIVERQRKCTVTVTFNTTDHEVSVDPTAIEKIYGFWILGVDEVIWDGHKSSSDCPYSVAELRDGSKFAIHVGDGLTIRHDYFGERVY